MSLFMSRACLLLTILLSSCVQAQSLSIESEAIPGEKLTVTVAPVAQQEKVTAFLQQEGRKLQLVTRELEQLNRTGEVRTASPELLQLLRLCESWETKTQMAFSCRSGGLATYWQAAARAGEAPDRKLARQKARAFLQQRWAQAVVIQGGQVSLSTEAKSAGVLLAPEGLLQGFVLDQLTEKALAYSAQQKLNLQGLQLQTAQQLRCWRKDSNGSFCALHSKSAAQHLAMAMIDPWAQPQKMGPYSFSCSYDPVSGWAVEARVTSKVIAESSVAAAVAAQVAVVKPISAAINWIDSIQPAMAARVSTEKDAVFTSKNWYLWQPDALSLWKSKTPFSIVYQTREQKQAEAHRPYLALWIATPEQQLVRQLVLIGDDKRWMKEIQYWWRRYGRNNETSIDGLASATQPVGKHQYQWDGRDDQGRPLTPGHYVLQVEAAREKGGRERVSLPFELTGQSFSLQGQGETELGKIQISFNPETDSASQ